MKIQIKRRSILLVLLPIFMLVFAIWMRPGSAEVTEAREEAGRPAGSHEVVKESAASATDPEQESDSFVELDEERQDTSKPTDTLARARASWDRYEVVGGVDSHTGHFRRATFYHAEDFKYGLLRFDETFDSNPETNDEAVLLYQEAYVADHILVRLKPEQDGLVDAVLNRFPDLKIRETLHTGRHVLIEFPLDNFELNQFAFWTSRLEAVGLVAEKDRLTFSAVAPPGDPKFGEQWALDNTGQTGGTVGADINALLAWDIQKGSSDVIVAVIDTGVDLEHKDLKTNLWKTVVGTTTQHGLDVVSGGFEPNDTSESGHGTHVAGVIGALPNNGRNIAGINWNVRIMPIRVLNNSGVGTWSGLVEGINYAVSHGASIINLSLGASGNGSNSDDDSVYFEIKKARDALPKGVLVVAAAGNDETDLEERAFYPAAYTLSNIISVASSDHNDELSDFSNFGKISVDLAAPGEDILSTLPGSKEGLMSGTSMAAPHVAGVAALIKAQDPNLNYLQIKNLILNTVDKRPAFKDSTVTGGRLNANNALLTFGGASAVITGINLRPLGGINNGDDILTSGEDMLVDVSVRNFGKDVASNVSLTLEVVDGNAFATPVGLITIALPNLAPGQEIFIEDAFQLHAEALGTFDFEQEVEIKLSLNYDPGGSDTRYAKYHTYQSATLSGHVYDGVDGVTPIEGAKVSIKADLPAGTFDLEVETDANGMYVVDLFTGLVTVTASAEGYLGSVPKTIDLNPIQPNQTLDIVLGQGDFKLLTPTIDVRVPAAEKLTVGARIANTGTSPNPLLIGVDPSEDGNFYVIDQLYGLKGVGTTKPVIVLLNTHTFEVEEEFALSLPAGRFAIDFTYHNGSMWILAIGGKDHPTSAFQFNVGTWKLVREVGVDLNNDSIVYTESILSMPFPAPTASDPDAKVYKLGFLVGHNFKFNGHLYVFDPDFVENKLRTDMVGELEDDLVWLWESYRTLAGASGLERETFFHGRGLDLNEWTIDGPKSVNEVSTKVLFSFAVDEGDFPLRDVRSLAYFGFNKSLYVLTQGVTRNIVRLNWDEEVVAGVYTAPSGVERITAASRSEISWMKLGFREGSIPVKSSARLPVTLDTAGLANGSVRSAVVRIASPMTQTVEFMSVKLTVGSVALGGLLQDSGFIEWYQERFGVNPTSNSLEADTDGDGIPVLLEYVVGGNPLVADNVSELLPRVLLDPNTNDIFVKFRRRIGMPAGLMEIQGTSNLALPWTTLTEGTDYNVLSTVMVDDDIEELTISTPYNTSGFFQLVVNP